MARTGGLKLALIGSGRATRPNWWTGRRPVIETNCRVDRDGAHPEDDGQGLPLAIRGLVQQVKAYEQLTVEAAVTGCRRTALHALLNHPLVPGYRAAQALLEDIFGRTGLTLIRRDNLKLVGNGG